MNNLNRSHQQIQSSWRSLQNHWEIVCEQWNDPVRNSFEREFWQLLEQETLATLRAVHNMAETIEKINWNLPDC